MNIILFGPPGAGKGTQGDNLVRDFNLVKISTGDLLRDEINKKNTLGNEIDTLINKGSFVPDKIINNLIENLFLNKNYLNRFIFDGYPRNLSQLENLNILLKKYNQKISLVINLNVDLEILTKRILGRLTCSKCGSVFNKFYNPPNENNHSCELKFLQTRSDDNAEIIKNRFSTYIKETKPVMDYYKKQNLLHVIDGKNEISFIYKEICRIITSIETWLYTMYLYKYPFYIIDPN